ncbi:MAG: hypothetical protein ED556_06920 [Winogradskyella sp.]|uniref:hypothetical protein n=1 Tax=Winogradskyella sp. TaxID=1883156 RepID=UPI000F402E2B|nr:hypothetical protein [Winogradskyella sp.]RNC87148.1 MAG: hypothetical protein ED556_06920 [Winogradskyella sp.]
MEDNKDIEHLFDGLKNQFDLETPTIGHEARFLKKLESQSEGKSKPQNFWRPFLAIAASVVIALTVFTSLNAENELTGLASVSPEMSETQDFFTATIREELKKLDAERTPLTQQIIYEAERQLKALEEDYAVLKKDLEETGNDERIIYAMISNFQSRIEILKNILNNIEDLKKQTI